MATDDVEAQLLKAISARLGASPALPDELASLGVDSVKMADFIMTIEAQFDNFLGFSFVTISTLGYGSVVPTTARADALATSEAVVGQIYLTVLVARLVAMHMRSGDKAVD